MTERGGGSDVADGTRTLAKRQPDGSYRLFGYKWFTSAIDADITFATARIEDDNGQVIQGNRGLGCFFVRVRDDNGKLNNIRPILLKDKLGMRQLPTAEIELSGAKAVLVSDKGAGIRQIAVLFNVTRIHNAVMSTGSMGRCLQLNRRWTRNRKAFGSLLAEKPLHLETLAAMEIQYRASLYTTFETVRLLGLVDCGKATRDDKILFRLFIPLIKLYTGKYAVSIASETIEVHGGVGYLETSGVPILLRDAQVLPVWEGPSNIMSLDILRAIARSGGKSLTAFYKWADERLDTRASHRIGEASRLVAESFKAVRKFLDKSDLSDANFTLYARDLGLTLARLFAATTLVEHARWSKSDVDAEIALRFASGISQTSHVDGDLVSPLLRKSADAQRVSFSRAIALGEERARAKL